MNTPQLQIPHELAAQPFWVKLVIQMALSTLGIFIQTTALSPAVKAAAQTLINDGQKLEALL